MHQMEIVTDEQEIQRLRLTAAELAEGLRVRPTGRESYIGFLKRYFQWFIGGKNGQVPKWENGRRNPAGPWSPWNLD